MYVVPVPLHGDIVVGRDATGRVLRVSAHPELDRVVLSIWQEGRCMATVRLASQDVPDLVRALTAAVVENGAASSGLQEGIEHGPGHGSEHGIRDGRAAG